MKHFWNSVKPGKAVTAQKKNQSAGKLQTCFFHIQRNVEFVKSLCHRRKFSFFKLLLLPATRSQTELVYSTHSDELWSSRSQALGWCFYANTSVLGSSGTPPMLTSRSTSQHQGLLGRVMRPMTLLDRAGHLKREGKRIIWSGFSNCSVSESL